MLEYLFEYLALFSGVISRLFYKKQKCCKTSKIKAFSIYRVGLLNY
nr:MAG TPA: hypothetical protein [Bacteriophage sp.]